MAAAMLDDLPERHPLCDGWTQLETFFETARIGGSAVHLAGFATVNAAGETVTGSAASSEDEAEARTRAYFELLERTAVVDAIAARGEELELRTRSGRRVGRVRRGDVFASSPCPDRWRPARSNGVAIHRTWDGACDGAWRELVERDRVLRSWYGESAPTHCELAPANVPLGVRRLARWSAYVIAPTAGAIGDQLFVAVVAGFPYEPAVPLAVGFAARADRARAVEAAAAEAVQRFAFLFGEEIPETAPASEPTPDFHQEFFLYPPAHELLRAWLEGEAAFAPAPAIVEPEVVFVDLTPPQLRGAAVVVKAISPAAEPLVFGEPSPHRAGASPERRVHPVA